MKSISVIKLIKPLSQTLSIIFLIFFLLVSSQNGKAQTLTIFADTMSVENGDTVKIPIKVKDFNQIATLQFGVSWDTSIVEFIKVTVPNNLPSLTPSTNFGPVNMSNGILTFAWFDPTIMGQTLTDNDTIFTIVFKAIGDMGESSEIDVGSQILFIPAEASDGMKILDLNIKDGLVIIYESTPPIIIPSTPIPTLNQWSLLIFGLLVLNLGLLFIRKKEVLA